MPLNKDLLCQTSAWHNNCGLNGLTHFLAFKIESGELIKKFSQDPHYLALLDSFQEYYDLPNRPTWGDIRALFKKYPAATDREAIFAPVLRKYLGKVILSRAEGLWDFHGAAALADYLAGTSLEDLEAIVASNRNQFQKIKKKHERGVSAEEIQAEAKNMWMKQGCKNYAAWMSDLNRSEMISAEQLGWLSEALHISIETYFKENTQQPYWATEKVFPWHLKFHNAHGAHWKFEAPQQNVAATAAHNQHYLPDEFSQKEEDAYFENDAFSGKFKIYAGRGEGKEEWIKDSVRAEIVKRPQPVLVAEAEKTAQVSINQLIDKLEHLLQEQRITEKQQKKIFEQYFDKFQEALGQKPPAAQRAVDKIVKEINQLIHDENKENEPPTKKRRKI